MITLSAYWSPKLERALKKRLKLNKHLKHWTMSLVGEQIEAVMEAVNQGIDAHLEACYVPERGDVYKHGKRSSIATEDTKHWKKGDEIVYARTLECIVSPQSLVVLIRRLMESDNEVAEHLASDVCGILGIELL